MLTPSSRRPFLHAIPAWQGWVNRFAPEAPQRWGLAMGSNIFMTAIHETRFRRSSTPKMTLCQIRPVGKLDKYQTTSSLSFYELSHLLPLQQFQYLIFLFHLFIYSFEIDKKYYWSCGLAIEITSMLSRALATERPWNSHFDSSSLFRSLEVDELISRIKEIACYSTRFLDIVTYEIISFCQRVIFRYFPLFGFMDCR